MKKVSIECEDLDYIKFLFQDAIMHCMFAVNRELEIKNQMDATTPDHEKNMVNNMISFYEDKIAVYNKMRNSIVI